MNRGYLRPSRRWQGRGDVTLPNLDPIISHSGVHLALSYPCHRFADVKRRRKDAWLSYL
jgi:hypothetical protein